ncbi:MAG: hypothetical protein ACJ8CR_08385 [Roseiflexaceae bacterium]
MCSRWYASLIVALLLGSIALTGCGINESAQAEPPHGGAIVLPTAPPMPTSPPLPSTPTAPPAPAQAAPAGAAVLTADFGSTANLAQWTVVDIADALPGPSIWQIHDGHLSPISDAGDIPSQYGTALITGYASWRDYGVTVAAYNIDNDTFGVVARASDRGFYSFNLVPAGDTATAALMRYDTAKGVFQRLAHAELSNVAPRQWTTLRLLVRGDQLSAFVDGQQVLQASDATLDQGRAGVYGYAMGGLEFDNFSVQTLAGQ